MSNWVRMMGITTAHGPMGQQPMGTEATATQPYPTRQGALCQAVGTRTGMAELARAPQSASAPCGGGPLSGATLGDVPRPRPLPLPPRREAPPYRSPFDNPPVDPTLLLGGPGLQWFAFLGGPPGPYDLQWVQYWLDFAGIPVQATDLPWERYTGEGLFGWVPWVEQILFGPPAPPSPAPAPDRPPDGPPGPGNLLHELSLLEACPVEANGTQSPPDPPLHKESDAVPGNCTPQSGVCDPVI